MGEKEAAGKLPPILCIDEVIFPKFVQTEAYIGAQCIGNYQKKLKLKAITRTTWEEKKNCNKNNKSVKCR